MEKKNYLISALEFDWTLLYYLKHLEIKENKTGYLFLNNSLAPAAYSILEM